MSIKWKFAAGAVGALAMVGGAVRSAEAHTPTVTPGCGGITVTLANYEGGVDNNLLVIRVDGTAYPYNFASALVKTIPWNGNGHTWSVEINANLKHGNATQFDKTTSGRQEPCSSPSTAPPSTPTTTPQASTTSSTAAPVASTSTPAATSVPGVSTTSTDSVTLTTATVATVVGSTVAVGTPPLIDQDVTPKIAVPVTTGGSSPTVIESGSATPAATPSVISTQTRSLPSTCFRAENCNTTTHHRGVNWPLVAMALFVGVAGAFMVIVFSNRKVR